MQWGVLCRLLFGVRSGATSHLPRDALVRRFESHSCKCHDTVQEFSAHRGACASGATKVYLGELPSNPQWQVIPTGRIRRRLAWATEYGALSLRAAHEPEACRQGENSYRTVSAAVRTHGHGPYGVTARCRPIKCRERTWRDSVATWSRFHLTSQQESIR